MSDALPADKELRVRLQRKRLVRVNVAIASSLVGPVLTQAVFMVQSKFSFAP